MTARQNAPTHQNRVSPQGSGVGAHLAPQHYMGFSAVSPTGAKIWMVEIARYVPAQFCSVHVNLTATAAVYYMHVTTNCE